MASRHKKCTWSLAGIKIVNIYRSGSSVLKKTALNLAVVGCQLGNFPCNKCEKSFGQKASLIIHRRKHSQSKPYTCDTCSRNFVTRAGLMIHKTSHGLKQTKIEKLEPDNGSTADHNLKNQIPSTFKSEGIVILKNESTSKCKNEHSGGNNNNRAHRKKNSRQLGITKNSTQSHQDFTSKDKGNKVVQPCKIDPRKDPQKKIPTMSILTRSQVKKNNTSSNNDQRLGHNDKRKSNWKRNKLNVTGGRNQKNTSQMKTNLHFENDEKKNRKIVELSISTKSNVNKKSSKSYKCDICPKICSDASNLKTHRRLHTGEKPFKCTTCSKSFRIKACLNIHARVHTGEKPYCCSICSKTFKYQNTFKRHLASHQPNTDAQIICKICEKQFPSREFLWDHKQKTRKCDKCPQLFCSFSELNLHKHVNHIDRFSVGNSDEKFCQFCKKTFKTNYTFLAHMQKHAHKGMPITFPCPKCSETFDSYDLLRFHKKTHSQKREKCVTCPWIHCGKKLTSQRRLDSHLKRHNGETRYLCFRCGMHFTDCVFYLKHKRACYQRATKYGCSMCGKTLSGHSALQKHILSHKGEKPCQCEICGSRFNNSSHLKRHKLIHVRKGEMPPFENSNTQELLYYPIATQNDDNIGSVEIENKQIMAYFVDRAPDQIHLQTDLLSVAAGIGKEEAE